MAASGNPRPRRPLLPTLTEPRCQTQEGLTPPPRLHLGLVLALMLRTGTGSDSGGGVRKMRRWLLASGLIAAAAASPALAADIDGVPPPPPSGQYGAPYSGQYHNGPYGDPRYAPRAQPPSYYGDEDDDRPNGPPAQKYSYGPPK